MMVFFDKAGAVAGNQKMNVNDPDFKKVFRRLKRLHRKGELPGLGKASADHHVMVQEIGGQGAFGLMTAATSKTDGAAILNFFDNTGKWVGRKEYSPRGTQFFQIIEEVKKLMENETIPKQIVHIDVPDHPNNVPRLIIPGNIKSAEEEADLRMSNFTGMAARAAIKRGS
jgi:hypothetical protein